jgi:hypothetical protein
VRRLSRWTLAVVSALAVWRLWTRRRRARDEPAVVEPDPADELRRKLAETREETPAAAPVDDAEAAESLQERRARVHAKAQQATDAMREDET